MAPRHLGENEPRKFHQIVEIVMDNSTQARLEKALSGLSDDSGRRIWDPIDFDSEWYRAEVEICEALCDNAPGLANETAKAVQKRMSEVDDQWKASKGNPRPQKEDMIQLVEAAKKQWMLTDVLLIELVGLNQLSEGAMVSKCHDRIGINLWHLQIHRNGLEIDPSLRTMTLSHLKCMAEKFKVNPNQGGQVVTKEYVAAPTPQDPRGSIVTSNPTRQRKTREGQAEFSRNLEKIYKCDRFEGPHKERWCPVTKDWIPAKQTTAAHIVPYSLGNVLAEDLFGYGTTLMDERNGLFLHEDVEKAFDNAQLVILLDNAGHTGQSLQAYVIDEKLRSQSYGGGKYQWADVHESELDFRDGVTARPARRYLYFHMLFTVIRLSIYKPPNWVNSLPKLTAWPMLPTNGEYLQRGILLNIVRVIGDPDIERRLKEYIPKESTLQKLSPFPMKAPFTTHETSEEVMGWLTEMCELDAS
ncbi:hypothetical protein N0V90_007975 [Kalmusia sp. IMI 367209]|nr:hypothetical protein N0V90_007975 [Kalmusia sp. IMI 367209]